MGRLRLQAEAAERGATVAGQGLQVEHLLAVGRQLGQGGALTRTREAGQDDEPTHGGDRAEGRRCPPGGFNVDRAESTALTTASAAPGGLPLDFPLRLTSG